MEPLVEYIVDDSTPADAWSSSVAENHDADAAWLAGKVDEFLASGGQIQAVAQGVSGEVDSQRPLVWGGGTTTLFTAAERQAAADRAAKRNADWLAKTDGPFVAKIGPLLDVYEGRAAYLCAEVGIRVGRLQRLLQTYFKDDPRATPYLRVRKVNQDELAARVRQVVASGVVGLAQVAQAAGVSEAVVRALRAKYGIAVPLAPSGQKARKLKKECTS